MQHRVRDLSPAARHLIENLIGHAVGEEETISIRSIPDLTNLPAPEWRRQRADELAAYFDRINDKIKDVDEQEFDEAAEEAIQAVRKARHHRVK